MLEKDLRLLWNFTLRIGMYTGKENKERVVSFLYGYEIGRGNQCSFIEQLSQSIDENYKIKIKATGWSGQIDMLAEKLDTDWITIFKKQSLNVIIAKSSDTLKIELVYYLRQRIIAKMHVVDNHFRNDWITDWFGIVGLETKWFKEFWSKKELNLITKLESELRSYGKLKDLTTAIRPTDKLKIICANLERELNENKTRANNK